MVPAPQSRATRSASWFSQADVLFGVWQHKAMLDELAGFEIEFAQGFGVFTAGGERDQAEDVAGVEAVQTVGHPLLLVLFGERVVVEDGLPVWVWGSDSR